MKRLALLCLLFVFGLLIFGCPNPKPTPPAEPVVPPATNNTSIAQNNTTVVPPAPTGCAAMANVLQKDECYKGEAQSKHNLSACLQIYSADTKDECLLAFKGDDLSVCDQFTAVEKKDECYSFHAQEQKNSNLCLLISGSQLQDQCLQAIAPPCANITDFEEHSICQAIADQNYSLCESETCLLRYATALKDVEVCSLLSDEVDQKVCQSLVTNSNWCQSLTLTARKDFCYQKVATISGRVDFCYQTSKGSSYEDNCFTNLSIQLNNLSYCEKIGESRLNRKNCYQAFAIAMEAPETCAQIFAEESQDTCYREVAIHWTDPSYCSRLANILGQDNCYQFVLLLDGIYPEECREVANADWKDKCFTTAAVQTNNSSACNEIVNPNQKQVCQSKFPS